MKKKILFLKLFMLFLIWNSGNILFANNISLSNITVTGQDTIRHNSLVAFDISWENSWRNDIAGSGNGSPYNWDAAWVFVKYRIGTGPWQHAWLDSTGHVNPAGSTIATGLLDPSLPFNATSNPGMGAFIYRDANGSGTFSLTGVGLRWNYGANGVNDNDVVDIRVFAIEQVFVPEGGFFAGSGGNEPSAFYEYPTTANPFEVTGEEAITVGTGTTNLYYNFSTFGGDQLGPVPEAFPKGFKAFYCMKYEISQQEYVDFLNSLTQPQANIRKFTGSANRYAITGNKVGNYATTNPFVACSNLNWADLTAYFDWSGLRPLTELEYEKACRGTLEAVPNEYAWGATVVANSPYTLIYTGANNEDVSENYSTTAGNAAYGATTPYNGSVNGPVRVGIFAGNSDNSGRVTAGATYYGIMEMSGNLLEHFVTVGNPTGRSFTGLHGDGNLTSNGVANVENWPGTNSLGAGFKGGYWYYNANYMRVSSREGAAGTDPNRYNSDGGRGGRTAPTTE